MGYGTPSLLAATDNWGAFIFFAAWCFIALIYVYLMVPEIAGMGVEQVNDVFKGSWFTAYKRTKQPPSLEGAETDDGDQNSKPS